MGNIPVAMSTLGIQILVSNAILQGTRAPWRNAYSRFGAGNTQDDPGESCGDRK